MHKEVNLLALISFNSIKLNLIDPISRWRESGVEVLISTADITTKEGAERLLNESNKLGPVGGIFNLAAVLRDAFMENQSEADFRIVCKPKVDGNLIQN